VKDKACYLCGKEKLNKNEIGLTKKFLGRKTEFLYCLDCLADYLEIDAETLFVKIEEFKEQGCTLFF
jgi:hypothetical protein